MLEYSTLADSFTRFVEESGTRLEHSLCAAFGLEVGMEAYADSLAYAWEHWSRIKDMENPVGYLWRTGKHAGYRRKRRRPAIFPQPPAQRVPWVEPDLPGALASLPERQRIAVTLVKCFEYTLREAAEILDCKKTTVQNHVERGMAKLRTQLGVEA